MDMFVDIEAGEDVAYSAVPSVDVSLREARRAYRARDIEEFAGHARDLFENPEAGRTVMRELANMARGITSPLPEAPSPRVKVKRGTPNRSIVFDREVEVDGEDGSVARYNVMLHGTKGMRVRRVYGGGSALILPDLTKARASVQAEPRLAVRKGAGYYKPNYSKEARRAQVAAALAKVL